MSGKLKKTEPEAVTQEESSCSVASDEGKASSTFSLSCNLPQTAIPCTVSSAQQATEYNVTTGRQTRAPQHDDDLSSADVPKASTLESANKTRCTTLPNPRSTDLNRKNLMVLIQIMLKYLDNNDRNLRVEVKKAVADCTKKNREGHPDYRFLVDSITNRLRLLVGEMHWSSLENLMEHYRKNPTRATAKSSDSVRKFLAV